MPGTVKSSPLITVHDAYLPNLVADPGSLSITTKSVEPLVTSSIQSDWLVNVVTLVAVSWTPPVTSTWLSKWRR